MPLSSSSSSSSQNRLSLKAKNEIATREAMTQRRQEWTMRIRKTKKNQMLAMKRRYVGTTENVSVGNDTNVTMDHNDSISDLANKVMDDPERYLEAFQKALSSHNPVLSQQISTTLRSSTSVSSFSPEDVTDSLKLIHVLSQALTNFDASSSKLSLMAARALTNIAAMELPSDTEVNYYGHIPETWTSIFIKSNFWSAIHQVLTNPNQSMLDLRVQCCWALGNVIADSSQARTASIPLFPSLFQTLVYGFEQMQPSLCRNSAWAISSLVRGETSLDFVAEQHGLSPFFLTQLILSPEKCPSVHTDDVTWMEVAQEAAWIVAFLTSKDDTVVNRLLQEPQNCPPNPPRLVEALALRLQQALQQTSQASTWSSTEALQALRMTIPCLRSIGNIASSCQGKHLHTLLNGQSKSIVKSLAKLLEIGTFPSSSSNHDLMTASVEAAWASRTLLCDAGLSNHPSTDVAVPVLLPALCHCIPSPAKQDLKREVLSALWTASAAPPNSENSMGAVWATRAVRDDFLSQIGHYPRMISALVDIIYTSTDADMLHIALKLMNAILRRLPDVESLKQKFEECDGVNALEHICDVASSQSHYRENVDWDGDDFPAADIAADLIDDLFATPDDENIDMIEVAPVSNGTTFAFGLTEFTPMNLNTETNLMPRGRGRPVPSWMEEKHTVNGLAESFAHIHS
jgi:Importin beta binding domain